jgi:hypothetical protein
VITSKSFALSDLTSALREMNFQVSRKGAKKKLKARRLDLSKINRVIER